MEANQDLFDVNLGNMLQFWTNGRFVSTPHQVIHRGSDARISVPIFIYPDADAKMIPLGKPESEALIAGEVYYNDLLNIWSRDRGARFWTFECRGKEENCYCWKCM